MVEVVGRTGLASKVVLLRPVVVVKGEQNDRPLEARTTFTMTMYQFARRRSTKKQSKPQKYRK
ncbi:MAG: hypothetical protein P8175_05470 [Deltaproteobacteria bacterium]